MKTSYLVIALALGAFSVQAQQKNVQTETTTTVRTVKDSDGERKLIKSTTENQSQQLELKNADSKELNKDLVNTPTTVVKTTTVTAPDGTTRIVDVDRSANYNFDGKTYKVVLDNVGYTLIENGKKSGVLRNMGTNTYIHSANGVTSYGSFDENGNLVLHTYDAKTDKTSVTTYTKN